ncbi:MAG: carboxypeptidase-like regulatory domain-containing protein [Desulfobacterales bacterium]|nr:carboxypeptidase-like regulatory domain-containing protein [Desulfobacterales bacterium]MDX2511420.1 carboxypeptidase-like regulatory domain-containing protein [Desulfobacterales bacterium]
MKTDCKPYSLMRKWFFIWICLIPTLLFCSMTHASGIIDGTIFLTMPDGQVRPGDWIRMLLVQAPVDVPDLSGIEKANPYQRMETIRNLHMTFFIAARKKMSDPAFIIQSVLTTPEGVFQFPGVPPGAYYLLVTFPAMVKDHKVAWQIPVTVVDDQTTPVELNNENLLMPTYTRN